MVFHVLLSILQCEKLIKDGIINIDYRYIPISDEEHAGNAKYVSIIDENSLDFCLLDGAYREFCALKVVEKLKPGALLIIDNVNWYLPSNSYSPSSRTVADGPKGPIWKEVDRLINDWRRIWTSSGVTDTALFIKPCF